MDDYGYNIGRVAFNIRHYRPKNYDYEQLEPTLTEINEYNETDEPTINNDEEDLEYDDEIYNEDNFDEIKNRQKKLSTMIADADDNNNNEPIKPNNPVNYHDEHKDNNVIQKDYPKAQNNQTKKASFTIPNQSLLMKIYRGPTKIVNKKPFASWGYFIKFPNS